MLNKHQNYDSKKLTLWLACILAISVVCLVTVIGAYMFFFSGEITSDHSKWGTFGDYFGGTLNPILSFLALIALLLTIILQSRQVEISKSELEASRKELELTRVELAKTAEAAQNQILHFENEAQRTDLYRIIEKLSSRIINNVNNTHLINDITIKKVMDGDRNINENESLSFIYQDYQTQYSKTFKVIYQIENDLFELSKHIKKYENIGSVDNYVNPFPAFYKKEFCSFVDLLHSYAMIKEDVFSFYCK